jgi:anti-sigma regulatory factor (Ser/Thr protein kinase)
MTVTTAARTGRAQPCPDPPRRAPTEQSALLELGAVLSSPRDARAWTRQILREWQLASLADDAEAIIAELVTNAVRASAGLDQSAICLALAFDSCELAILVSDGSPDLPQAQHPANDAESGRGLLMVEALSDSYGWYRLEGDAAGKVVWAELRTVLMHPATPVLSDSPSKAPAWPGDDQPGHRRGPLLPGGHAGRAVTKGTRPPQQPSTGPGQLSLAAAEAAGEDAGDHAASRPVPPALPAAGTTASIR